MGYFVDNIDKQVKNDLNKMRTMTHKEKLRYAQGGRATGGSIQKLSYKPFTVDEGTKLFGSSFNPKYDINIKYQSIDPFFRTGDPIKDNIEKDLYLLSSPDIDEEWKKKYRLGGKATGGAIWKLQNPDYKPVYLKGEERKRIDEMKYNKKQPKFDWSFLDDFKNIATNLGSAINPFDDVRAIDAFANTSREVTEGTGKLLAPVSSNKAGSNMLKLIATLGSIPSTVGAGMADYYDKNYDMKAVDENFIKANIETIKNLPGALASGAKNYAKSIENLWSGDGQLYDFTNLTERQADKAIEKLKANGQYTKAKEKEIRNNALFFGNLGDFTTDFATGALVGGVGVGDMLRGSGKATSKLSSGVKQTQLDNLGKYVDIDGKDIINETVKNEIRKINEKGFSVSSTKVEDLANYITDEINTKRKVRTGNGVIGENLRKISDKTIAPYVNRGLYEISDKLNLRKTRQFKDSLEYEKYAKNYLAKKLSFKDLKISGGLEKVTSILTIEQLKKLNNMNPDEAQLFIDYLTGEMNDFAIGFADVSAQTKKNIIKDMFDNNIPEQIIENSNKINDNIVEEIKVIKNRRQGNRDLKQFSENPQKYQEDIPVVKNRRKGNRVNEIIQQINDKKLSARDEFVESMFERINETKRNYVSHGNVVDDYFENIKDVGEVKSEFTKEGWSKLMRSKTILLDEIEKKSEYISKEYKDLVDFVKKERRNLFRQIDATKKGTTGYYKDTGKKVARWYMQDPRFKKLVEKEDELIAIYKEIVDKNRANYKEYISKLTDEELNIKLNEMLNKIANGKKINNYLIKELKEELNLRITKKLEKIKSSIKPQMRPFPYQKTLNPIQPTSKIPQVKIQNIKYKIDAEFLENLHNKNPEMIKKLKDGRYLYEDKEAKFRKILKPGDKINYSNLEELTKIPVMKKRYKDITQDPAYYDIISDLERYDEIKSNSKDYELYKDYVDAQEELLGKTHFDDVTDLEHNLESIKSQIGSDDDIEKLSKKYKNIYTVSNAPDEKVVYKVKIKSDKVRTIREKFYKAKDYYDKSTFDGSNFDSMQKIGTPGYVMPYQIKKNMIDFINKYPEQFSIKTKKKLDEYLKIRSEIKEITGSGANVRKEMSKLFKTQSELLERIYEELTKGKPIQSIREDFMERYKPTKEISNSATIDKILNENTIITKDIIDQLLSFFPDDFDKIDEGKIVRKETGQIVEINEPLEGEKMSVFKNLKASKDTEYINDAYNYMKRTRADFANIRPEVTEALKKFATEVNSIISKEFHHGVMDEGSYQKYVANVVGKILFKQEINVNDIKRLKKHFVTEKYGFNTKNHNYKGLIENEDYLESLLDVFSEPEKVGEKLSELLANRYKISEDAIYDKLATNNIMNLVGYSPFSDNIPKDAKPYVNIGDIKSIIDERLEAVKYDIKSLESKIIEAEKKGESTARYKQQLSKLSITNPSMTKQQVYDAMNNYKRKIAKEEFGLDWDKDLDEFATPFLDLSLPNRKHLIDRFKKDNIVQMKYITDDNVKFWNFEREKAIKDNINIVNKIYTQYLTDMKTVVTSYNPAWHAKNFIQNYIHGFIQEGVAILNPKNRKISIELTNQIMGDTDYLGMTFKRKKGNEGASITDAKGRKWTYYELKKAIEENGLVESGLFGSELKDKKWSDLEGSAKVKSIYQNIVRPSGEKSIWSLGGLHNKSRQEAFSRVQIVLAGLDNGKSLPEAIRASEKALFNYNDVSMFEYNVLRKIIPFYSFMKNNIPFQITNMLNQPWKYQVMQQPLDYVDEYSQQNTEYENEDLDNTYHKIRLPFEKNVNLISKKGRPYKQPLALYANNLVPNINNVMQSDVMSNLAPPLQTISQLLEDKDYFGNKIHKGDSKKGLEYFFEQTLPITADSGKVLPKTWDKWFTNVQRSSKENKEYNKVSEILRLINPVGSKYYRVFE